MPDLVGRKAAAKYTKYRHARALLAGRRGVGGLRSSERHSTRARSGAISAARWSQTVENVPPEHNPICQDVLNGFVSAGTAGAISHWEIGIGYLHLHTPWSRPPNVRFAGRKVSAGVRKVREIDRDVRNVVEKKSLAMRYLNTCFNFTNYCM